MVFPFQSAVLSLARLIKTQPIMRYAFLFCFFIALNLNSSFAQEIWKHYFAVSNQLSSVAIDADGNKWCGTLNGGVNKFDDYYIRDYPCAGQDLNTCRTRVGLFTDFSF